MIFLEIVLAIGGIAFVVFIMTIGAGDEDEPPERGHEGQFLVRNDMEIS